MTALHFKPRQKANKGSQLCVSGCSKSGKWRISIIGYPLDRHHGYFCDVCKRTLQSLWSSATSFRDE